MKKTDYVKKKNFRLKHYSRRERVMNQSKHRQSKSFQDSSTVINSCLSKKNFNFWRGFASVFSDALGGHYGSPIRCYIQNSNFDILFIKLINNIKLHLEEKIK
jgi:hypothetical protein